MDAPKINTAIPKRRYQLGEYGAVVLGEIESGDGVAYEFVMALVQEGQAQPSLYITSERNAPGQTGEGSHRMRMFAAQGTRVLGSADELRQLDQFCELALSMAAQMLQLADEVPVRLS